MKGCRLSSVGLEDHSWRGGLRDPSCIVHGVISEFMIRFLYFHFWLEPLVMLLVEAISLKPLFSVHFSPVRLCCLIFIHHNSFNDWSTIFLTWSEPIDLNWLPPWFTAEALLASAVLLESHIEASQSSSNHIQLNLMEIPPKLFSRILQGLYLLVSVFH